MEDDKRDPKYERQCNLAWTSVTTTGDNLHSCWWHEDDASPIYARHWMASWTLSMVLERDYSYLELNEVISHIFLCTWGFVKECM
jgi:hypothetical protein